MTEEVKALNNREEDLSKPLKKVRRWTITLNNYEKEYDQFIEKLKEKTKAGIVGKEVAPNTGTPHLQCYVEFKQAQDMLQLKKTISPRAHFIWAIKDKVTNFIYCSKAGDYIQWGFNILKMEQEIRARGHGGLTSQELIKLKILKEYIEVQWRLWQLKLLRFVNDESSSRKILWVYDSEGNRGKTFLRKYLSLTRNTIIFDGKKADILNQLKTKCIDQDQEISLIIGDIPRDNFDRLQYGLIEQIKDGHVYSGKYEGAEVWLDKPNVIIFSNEYPDLAKFSNDRWSILNLDYESEETAFGKTWLGKQVKKNLKKINKKYSQEELQTHNYEFEYVGFSKKDPKYLKLKQKEAELVKKKIEELEEKKNDKPISNNKTAL